MKKLIVLPLLAFGLMMTSCKKKGCTDGDAKNFSSEAKKDDNSCTYEGRVVLWYDLASSTFLQGDGATSLTYYVDGKIVGSSATSIYWTSSPDCGVNGSITVTKDLGSEKSKSFQYSVVDQTGFTYYTGSIDFTANTCVAIQL